MRIAYCTTVLPSRRRTGGEIASQAFIDALRAAGHTVTVLGYRRPDDRSTPAVGEAVVGVRPIESDGAGGAAVAWLVRALAHVRPYSSEKYRSEVYRARLLGLLRDDPELIVVLDHAQMGFVAEWLPSTQPVIYVAHNVEEQLYRSQADAGTSRLRAWLLRREARLIGEMERRVARRALQVWLLTTGDQEAFINSCPGVSPIKFDLPGVAAEQVTHIGAPVVWDVGLIGTWTWAANAEGLRWFVEKVVPTLPPGVKVAIAGNGADEIVRNSATCLGFVPNAMEFMAGCKIVCVPAVAGGGVQIKTIDAIASGRPIVLTPMALRGIEEPPVSVRVAETPRDFVTRILELLSAGHGFSTEGFEWAQSRSVAFVGKVGNSIAQLEG